MHYLTDAPVKISEKKTGILLNIHFPVWCHDRIVWLSSEKLINYGCCIGRERVHVLNASLVIFATRLEPLYIVAVTFYYLCIDQLIIEDIPKIP